MEMVLRRLLIALTVAGMSLAAATEASAGHWHRYRHGPYFGPCLGYGWGCPFGYGGPGGWGYTYIPYDSQYEEGVPRCFRELRGRVRTAKGWRDRYATVCPRTMPE
ncbi:hypothetical protein [Bradyrhizobium sp. 2TAF24]|uniref:hypothetical protein n=1 Tax=Bradyrhizobium sp. 2TAF24 TaxID=3233011 RepID=UPI003F8FD9B2